MLRVKAGLFGALALVGGAVMLFSEVRHSLTGVRAEAVLVERVQECKAEYQPKGESRRKEAMPCNEAYAFRTAVGETKVRVHTSFLSVLRIPTANGAQITAKVSDAAVQLIWVPVGGRVQVVYNPQNPEDVRAPMTFARVQGYLGVTALGLFLLIIAFINPILRALLGAFTGKEGAETDRPTPRAEPAAGVPTLTRGQRALQEAAAAQKLRAGAAPQRFGRRAETRVAAAAVERSS